MHSVFKTNHKCAVKRLLSKANNIYIVSMDMDAVSVQVPVMFLFSHWFDVCGFQ